MALDQAGAPGRNDERARKEPRAPLSRTAIFAYDLAVLAALLLLAALYIWYPTYFKLGDDPYKLAIESMWFGALGGLIISLKGIYDHHPTAADGWDSSYNLWHLGRPASGAVAGLVTVVLLEVINAKSDLTRPVVYAAAFIFGTQERRFFNFLYEVARLVVQVPGEDKSGLAVTAVQPSEGPPGAVIVISGQGIAADASVKLGSSAVSKLVVSSDGTSAAGIVPDRPLGADTVDVIVANSSGKSAVLPGKFKFTS
jgi:hypothetical protein